MDSLESLWTDLYTRYHDRMYSYAYRRVGDRQIAENCVQELFIVAFLSIETVEAAPNKIGWLYKTLFNIVSDENDLRYHTAEVEFSEELFSDDQYRHTDTVDDFIALLPSSLSDEARKLLVWYIWHRYSHSDLDEHFGLTEVAVRKQYSRAKLLCRTLLLEDEKYLEKRCHKIETSTHIVNEEGKEDV